MYRRNFSEKFHHVEKLNQSDVLEEGSSFIPKDYFLREKSTFTKKPPHHSHILSEKHDFSHENDRETEKGNNLLNRVRQLSFVEDYKQMIMILQKENQNLCQQNKYLTKEVKKQKKKYHDDLKTLEKEVYCLRKENGLFKKHFNLLSSAKKSQQKSITFRTRENMDNSNISEKVTKEEERSKRKYPIRIDKKRYNRMGYSDKENVTFDKSF